MYVGGKAMARESFTFEYTPNLEDAIATFTLTAWRTPAQRIRTVLLFLGLSTLLVSWGFDLNLAVSAIIGMLWGGLFFVAFRQVFGRYLLRRMRERGEVQQVAVTSSGVEHRASGVTTHTSWSAVTRIEERPRFFLLFDGPRLVGCIEKSGIASGQELRELREFLAPKGLVSEVASVPHGA